MKTPRRFLRALALSSSVAAGISLLSASASADVTNGSFESDFTGWTKSGNMEIQSAAPYVATGGTKLVSFNSGQTTPNGLLSQSFATTPGTQYVLTFDFGALGVGSQQKLQLNVTGSSGLVNQLLTITGPGNSTSKWTSQSFPFIANSATTTVSFSDVSAVTNGVDLLLDKVKINDAGSGGPPVLGTNLLTNGSFEAAYNGWTPDGATRIEEPGPPYTTDGQKMLSFNVGQTPVNGKVSQAFATSPGTTYTVQYDFGTLGFTSTQQTVRTLVTGNGTLVNQTNSVTCRPDFVIVFIPVSHTFVANSGVTTLTISDASANGDALDGFVDNVRVIGSGGGGNTNTAPVATPDSYTTSANVPLTIAAPGVLGNDTDAQSNPLTATLVAVANPERGTVALNANGSFTFTPASGYTGPVYFTYKANDGLLDSNLTTVAVSVNAQGSQLLVNGSFESDFSGWTTTGNQNIQSSAPYSATNGTKLVGFNGGQLAPNAVLSQSFATVPGQNYSLNFDVGTLSYVSAQQKLQVTVAGSSNLLTQVITLNATSGGNNVWSPRNFNFVANSSTTTLTFRDQSPTSNSIDLTLDNVRVTETGAAPNTAPVAVAESYTTPQATALVVPANGVLGNDYDPELNPLTASLVANPAHGTLSFAANGGFTYTPTGAYNGPDSFTYKANDGLLDSNTVTVSINVTPTGGGSAGAFANGSFETGTFAPWTISGGNQYSVLIDSSLPATQGGKVVTFNAAQSPAAGVLTQTFATTPNVTYNVALDLGVLAFNTSQQSVLVSVTGNGSLKQMPFGIIGIGGGKVKWEAFSFPFTANSTTTTLTFTDTSPTTNSIDMLLDNVRVTKADARILTVDAILASNVPMTLSPLDNDGASSGNTLLTRNYSLGTVVNISAPITAANGAGFLRWVKNGVDYASTPVTSVTMTADTNLVAVYQGGTNPPLGPNILANGSFEILDGSAWATSWGRANSSNRIEQPGAASGYPTQGNNILSFNVGGTPTNGVASQSFPTTPGTTYTLQLDIGAYGGPNGAAVNQTLNITVVGTGNLLSKSVTLLGGGGNAIAWAPRTYTFTANSPTTFLYLADGSATGNGTDLFVDNVRVKAGIQAPSTILVESWNAPGTLITVATPDLTGQTNGTTSFTRNYDTGAVVSMVAPYQNFVKWLKNGLWYATNPSISIVVDGNSTYTAVYTETPVVGAFKNGSFENEFMGWTWTGSQQSVKVKDGLPSTDGLIIIEFNSNNSATDGAIRQTFTTTPGTTYSVLFDVGTKAFNTFTQTLKCQVLNSSNVSLASQNYSINGLGPNGDVYYVAKSLTFTANSSTSTLIFADQSSTGAGLDLLLDNVRVNAVAPGKAASSGGEEVVSAPGEETPVAGPAVTETPISSGGTVVTPVTPVTTEPKTGYQVIGGKKYLVLTIQKSALPGGKKSVVQVSPNLTDWFSGKKNTAVLLDNDKVLKVRDNTPVKPGAKRYIRVKP